MNPSIQTISNIAVVIGLIFVGVQIYQDRDLKRNELIAKAYESRMQANLALLGDDPVPALIKAAYDPKNLTPEETLTNYAYLDLWVAQWDQAAFLERAGLYTPAWTDGYNYNWAMRTQFGDTFMDQYIEIARLPPEFKAKLKEQRNSQTSPSMRERIELWRTSGSKDE